MKQTKLTLMVLSIVILLSACSITYKRNETKIPASTEKEKFNIHPYTYDIKLAKEKGLLGKNDKDVNEAYLELQKVYRIVLEEKLKKEYHLEDLDAKLHEYDEFIKPHDKEDLDYNEGYQMQSTMKLDYIYLRSNIHLENLSEEDIKLLKSKRNIKKPLKDQELIDLIERTYLDVLRVNYYGDKNVKPDQQIPYNTHTSSCCALEPQFFADQDSIILSIQFETVYNDEGNHKEGYQESRQEVLDVIENFEVEANQIYKTNVMVYNR